MSTPRRTSTYGSPGRRRPSSAVVGGGCLVFIVAFMFVVIVTSLLFDFLNPLWTKREVPFKVNRLERIQNGDSSKYLVFTDKGVFEDTDKLILGKFNSSDVYNQLREGRTYTCLVTGYRVHVLSWYPDIINCKPTG